MTYAHSILIWWDSLFFEPTNTLTSSMLRIMIGAIMIYDSIFWWKLSRLLLSPDGWYGYEDYAADKKKYFYFSTLKFMPRNLGSVHALILIQLVASIFILLGIYPNYAALVCFITLVSIHNRNLYVLNSGDTVRRFLILFLIIAPSGGQLSILDTNHLLDTEAKAWPLAVVMLNFFAANIYLKNIFYKLHGASWQNGTATKRALGVRIISRMSVPSLFDKKWFYAITTYGTLVIETALFTLIWFEPFRIPVIISGILLHVGMGIFLRLQLFQLSMIILLCSFIKPEEYLQLIQWLMH